MGVTDFIQKQPRWWLAALGVLVIVAFYLISTDNWTGEMQLLILGGGAILAMMTLGDTEQQMITLEEAMVESYEFIRDQQVKNVVPSGTLKPITEGKLQYYDGEPKHYHIGIKLVAGGRPVYVVTIDAFKTRGQKPKVLSWTKKSRWDIEDRPNVEIIRPPDVVSLIEAMKRLGVR